MTYNMTKQVHKDMVEEFGVEELDWPAPQPVEQFWDELERRLRASCPTSVSDFTNALLDNGQKFL